MESALCIRRMKLHMQAEQRGEEYYGQKKDSKG